jgi:hypothetical protein
VPQNILRLVEFLLIPSNTPARLFVSQVLQTTGAEPLVAAQQNGVIFVHFEEFIPSLDMARWIVQVTCSSTAFHWKDY